MLTLTQCLLLDHESSIILCCVRRFNQLLYHGQLEPNHHADLLFVPNGFKQYIWLCVSLQKSHVTNQALPPVPDAVNPIPLTEDGYATLQQESHDDHNPNTSAEISSGGYTLLSKEQPKDEADDTGYDEVNGQDVIRSHYEMSEDLPGGEKKDDDHDYEEPYWEPANKEEELMDQLSKLNVPVILAKDIEWVEL